MTKNVILLIDDHKEFRQMLQSFIENQVENVEIKEAGTGEEGVEIAIEERPRIALIDIRLPRMDGIEAAREIKRNVPECHIITMSMFRESRHQKFVTQEVVAFIEKDKIDDGLIPLLHRLLDKHKSSKWGEGQ